jgi:putative NIF3 family GTP cyclohydrolase 1 type 2
MTHNKQVSCVLQLRVLAYAILELHSQNRTHSNISKVYSPHTAIDCARGGLGDWLADIVTGRPTALSELEEPGSAPPTSTAPTASAADLEPENPLEQEGLAPPARPSYMLQHHPSQLTLDDRALALGGSEHKRYPITASTLPGHPGAGMGRIVRFDKPVPLPEIIDRIGLGLGNPKGFPIAVPQGKQAGDMMIGSVGICAGSGGSLFSQMEKDGEDVDLYFTGELSHHEALAAIEKGKSVICLFHSNTERGFLHGVLRGQLETAIGEEWERVRKEELQATQLSEEFKESLEDEQYDVAVSEVDRDPYGIMIAKSEL